MEFCLSVVVTQEKARITRKVEREKQMKKLFQKNEPD